MARYIRIPFRSEGERNIKAQIILPKSNLSVNSILWGELLEEGEMKLVMFTETSGLAILRQSANNIY